MAKQNRKERRKHLQPQIGTEKKDKQLISELKLVKPTENAAEPDAPDSRADNPISRFFADYRSYREEREQEDHDRSVRRKRLGLFGAVTMVFAVIGIIASVRFCVSASISIANQSGLKEELKPYLAPYVVTDAPAFSDDSGLSDTVKQRITAWYLLLNTDISIYQQDDYSNVFVPEADMNLYAKQLFGEGTVLQPKSDYTGSLIITYDAESASYLLPLQPDYATYYPNITSIKKEKNGYILQVQYMASDLLANLKSDSEATVIKTMQYHLLETETGYQVISLKLVSIEADGYYQPDTSVSDVTSSEETDPTETEEDRSVSDLVSIPEDKDTVA